MNSSLHGLRGPFVCRAVCLAGLVCVRTSTTRSSLDVINLAVLDDAANKRGIAGVPKGEPGAGKNKNGTYYGNSKSLRIFPGFAYRSIEESAGDMSTQIAEKGWF